MRVLPTSFEPHLRAIRIMYQHIRVYIVIVAFMKVEELLLNEYFVFLVKGIA